MIQKLYTLAEIPPDPIGSDGHILAADVHTNTGSRKRKRSEIALAIDHQGVNVYDIKSSKQVTSYAISPQAHFTCPPCSTSYRRQRSEPARRLTYCSLLSPVAEIKLFSESLSTETNPLGSISVSSTRLDKSASPIIALDTVCFGDHDNDGSSSHRLLAVHEDGLVTCYSQDLASEEWSKQIWPKKESGTSGHLIFAALCNIEQARRSLLRDREDVLATLSAVNQGVDSSILVVAFRGFEGGSKGQGDLGLKTFSVQSGSTQDMNLSIGHARGLREFCSLTIPDPDHVISKHSKIGLHVPSGTLYQSTKDYLAVYDLTDLIPRLVHKLRLDGDATCSSLRLSSNLLAYNTVNSLTVIDLPFCSKQAEVDLKDALSGQNNKSKLPENGEIELLSYFASTDSIIMRKGRSLLSVEMSIVKPANGESKKRKRNGYLINSIGQGSSTAVPKSGRQGVSESSIRSLGRHMHVSSTDDAWKNQKPELDRSSNNNDGKGFQTKAAALLELEQSNAHPSSLRAISQTRLDQNKVHYLLSRIFAVVKNDSPDSITSSDDHSAKLRVRIFPEALIEYLIKNEFLTSGHVEISMRKYGDLPPGSRLARDSLIQALAEQDPSLHFFTLLMESRTSLTTAEILHAVALVTRSTNSESYAETQRLLTEGDGNENDPNDTQMQLTNGETPQTPSPSPPNPPHGPNNHRILTASLKRLHAVPSTTLVLSLKQTLTPPQLRSLIITLRIQIAQSGWLSPYEDPLPTTTPQSQSPDHISHIAHLLNCVIDAIGTGGWILSTPLNGELNETADTIAYMKAEISAALEGIEEVTYLKGMLGEILLCGKDTLHRPWKQGRLKNQNQNQEIQQQMTAGKLAKPLTVSLQEESQLLPLGLKARDEVSFTKVGAGGEVLKRSKRDIGRQKSRMVGKYSFERIVV